MKAYLLALVLISVIAIAGCVGQVNVPEQPEQPQEPPQEFPAPEQPPPEVPSEEPPLYEPPAGTSSISILSPADGATLEGTTAIGVRVDVQNFRLVGGRAEVRENEGQIHGILEGPVAKEQYTPYKTFSFSGLEPGTYTVTVELVDSQKNQTGVSDSVTVTIA